MKLNLFIFLGVFCAGCLPPLTEATTCSSSNNVCASTLRVTTTCTSDKCVCSGTGYTAVDTGCAVPLTDMTPTVRTTDGTTDGSTDGVYSGEVFAGESLDMRCDISPFTSSAVTTYKWFVDSTEQSGQNVHTFTYSSIIATTNVQITCQVFDSGLQSGPSSNFNVKGYDATGGTISLAPQITGGKSKVTTGSTMTLACINRPKDDSGILEYVWNDAGTTKNIDLVVTAFAGATRTCTVQPAARSSRTFLSVAGPASFTLPSAAVAATTITAVEISSPSAAITINQGATPTVTCQTTDQDIIYRAADVTWSWTVDGAAVTGATTSLTLSNSLTVGAHTVVCKGAFGGNAAVSSTGLTVTVSDSLVTGVLVLPDPAAPVVTGYMKVRCLVAAPSLTGLTYSWLYDDNRIARQDDHTLQINSVVDASHGNGNKYKCLVSSSQFSESDESDAVTAVAFGTLTPTITSNELPTYNFGTGNTYTLTCTMTSTTPGMTYKWWKAGVEVTSQTAMTYSITATSASVNYKCQAFFTTLTSLQSPDFTVLGKDIRVVVLSGLSSPVVGTSPTLDCTVYTGASTGAPTYSIQVGGTVQSTSSSHTISSIASGTSDGAWKCVVTIGSQTVDSNIINLAAVSTPVTPTVQVSTTEINTGGSYTFTCDSASHDSTAVYAWVKTSGGSETVLSSTARTYSISSAAATDAGDYKCKLTVNSVASSFSTSVTITFGATLGKPCTSANFHTQCTTDFDSYTGNCISNRCECVTGIPLYQDTCGATGGATTVVASALALCLGWLTYHLMP